MSQSTRAQLEALKSSLLTPGTTKVSAENLRTFQTAIIDSLINAIDDADENDGYLKVGSAGRVDVSKVNSADAWRANQILRGDGTWKNSATGRATLNGTGVQTTFNITHGMGFAPNRVIATPGSADAAKVFYTTNYGAITFDVVYLVAPSAGTGNVIINFLAE